MEGRYLHRNKSNIVLVVFGIGVLGVTGCRVVGIRFGTECMIIMTLKHEQM